MPGGHSHLQKGLLESVGAGQCLCVQMPEIKEGAVQAVSDVDTLLHVLYSMCQHARGWHLMDIQYTTPLLGNFVRMFRCLKNEGNSLEKNREDYRGISVERILKGLMTLKKDTLDHSSYNWPLKNVNQTVVNQHVTVTVSS